MKDFPYKTLIWAVVAVIALFLFREGLEHLIFKMEEVVLFDRVKVKVNKSESEALAVAEQEFEKKEVQLGLSDGIQIEVLNGLDTTTQIKVQKKL